MQILDNLLFTKLLAILAVCWGAINPTLTNFYLYISYLIDLHPNRVIVWSMVR